MIKHLPYPQSNLLSVIVEGEDYDEVLKTSDFMSCYGGHRRGEWASGYMNTKDDPKRAQRTGRIGEVAFAKLMHLQVDGEYRYDGDEYDFKIHGKTIDVKTSFAHGDPYRTMKTTDKGVECHYDCDYYIFCYRDYDHYPYKKESLIIFDGYVLGKDIRDGKFAFDETNSAVLAYNYLIPYRSLIPFKEFYHKAYKGQL